MENALIPATLLVSDSSGLIALDHVGRLDLLPALYAAVLVPRCVAEETGIARPWMEVRNVPTTPMLRLLSSELDAGEAEAIVLATSIEACELLIDERKGRRVAAMLGLQVVGTLAVLIRAKDRGLLREIRTTLDALVHSGFRVSPTLDAQALRRAREATE